MKNTIKYEKDYYKILDLQGPYKNSIKESSDLKVVAYHNDGSHDYTLLEEHRDDTGILRWAVYAPAATMYEIQAGAVMNGLRTLSFLEQFDDLNSAKDYYDKYDHKGEFNVNSQLNGFKELNKIQKISYYEIETRGNTDYDYSFIEELESEE